VYLCTLRLVLDPVVKMPAVSKWFGGALVARWWMVRVSVLGQVTRIDPSPWTTQVNA
jgi:hypothetical protein